jgi:hypothetical protein
MIGIEVPGRLPQVGRWTFTDQPVAIEVLQDRDGLRALLIPVGAGSATALASGEHHLTLALTRTRVETTAPPDDVNRYVAAAGVTVTV